MTGPFIPQQPSLEDNWRGIILLGRNVASYKFALAKTLLELKPVSGQLVKLEELAPVFAGHIAKHIQNSDKQGTSKTSKFLDGCRAYGRGEISEHQLSELAVQYGFNNVIDAFHVVGSGAVSHQFYVDERKTNKGIRITDEFSELLGNDQAENLPKEVEARWRLVETAWQLGMARRLITVHNEPDTHVLCVVDRNAKRTQVTSCRDALNGYQKGKCFYCCTNIRLDGPDELRPDVDHFFPHVLKQPPFSFGSIIDGVWNLVLACRQCNRGQGGKFHSVPTIRLLERLSTRNEWFISSHNPLRQTLIQQSGSSTRERQEFLNTIHSEAWKVLIHTWEPQEEDGSCFEQ